MGGPIAVLPKTSAYARHDFLAFGDMDGVGAHVRAFLAAPLDRSDLDLIFEGQWQDEQEVRWNQGTASVIARSVHKVGSLVVEEKPLDPRGENVLAAMVEGIQSMGISCLPWDKAARVLVDRSEWLRTGGHVPSDWPDLSDESLAQRVADWLGPYLDGVWKKDHLSRLDLPMIIGSQFSHRQRTELDRLAPTHIEVPSGSRIAIEYRKGETPVLAVKLQEMFGATKTPAVAGGRANVVLHLLSPARRPLGVTQDLPSFWKNTYPKVRTQMRADYPRHPWPEDPLTASPTRKTVRKKSD
jgi:ATP-dependent helicase HrpB